MFPDKIITMLKQSQSVRSEVNLFIRNNKRFGTVQQYFFLFNLQICPVYFLSFCTINIQTGKIANNLVIWQRLCLSISWSLINID